MRVVIAGQKYFGAEVLELCLRAGDDVAAVSCPINDSPDRLQAAAEDQGIPVIDSRALNAVTVPPADLIIAAHCHSFISQKTRDRARFGALGFHPSLLPLHRGRSAIEWALRMRDRVTGGTVYWFNDLVDGGPIAAQEFCLIRPGDDARTLWTRDLAPMGLRLFARVLNELRAGKITAAPQDHELATWEPALENVPPLSRRTDICLKKDAGVIVGA